MSEGAAALGSDALDSSNLPGQAEQIKIPAPPPKAAISLPMQEPVKAPDGRRASVADHDAATDVFTEQPEKEMDALEIKARTMYRMIEEITIGNDKKKLLFLTNDQADLLSSTPGSIHKVLEAFELPKPKLVINLLKSLGAPAWYDKTPPNMLGRNIWKDIETGNPPWMSVSEAQKSMEGLVMFMQEVIIPMAAETNAIILCNPNKDECMLTSALSHALFLTRSKWPGGLPFSLLASGSGVLNFYLNPDETALWRQVRRKSAHWRQRDKLLLDLSSVSKIKETHLDLNEMMSNLIIIDAVDERKSLMNQNMSWANFMTEINRELTSTLPSVCLKTGLTIKAGFTGFVGAAAIEQALNAAMSGSPVVLLDHRMRPPILAADRAELVGKGIEALTAHCDQLMGKTPPVCDNHDVCTLAFFHEVLFGTSMIENVHNEGDHSDGAKHSFVPICQAVEHHKRMQGTVGDKQGDSEIGGPLRPASQEEINRVIHHMTERMAQDLWALMPADLKAPLEAKGVTPEEQFSEIVYRINLISQQLFAQEALHSLPVSDVERAKKLIRELVKLDRLPKEEPFEGLLLVRDAWDEYDVTMSLANHYKILAKSTYVLLLLFGIAIITCTVLQQRSLATKPTQELCDAWEGGLMTQDMLGTVDISECGLPYPIDSQLGQSVFLLSLLSSLLLSVIGYLNPAARWRQLRTSACSLESMIWLYRARVGLFSQSTHDMHSSKNNFRASLAEWREELVSGTDLQNTKLERKHKPSIYKHYQYTPPEHDKLQHLTDDFYSPVKPEAYVQRRLQHIKEFYQMRIPERVRWRSTLQFVVFLASATAAALAYFEHPSYIAIISAFASAVTSWQEFTDAGRKIERYTGSVRYIKNLLSWWQSLSEVEKASSENITMLLVSGEAIITNEHRAWMSTAAAKKDNKKEEGEGGGSANKSQEGGAGGEDGR